MSLKFTFPITKAEKREDGSLLVAGRMTDETLDSQGDILDYDGGGEGGSKEAVSFWKGNVREAHDPKKPVGRELNIVPLDKERAIDVEVFVSAGAQDTQAKVLDKTLSAFSVGGDPPEKFKMEKRGGKQIRRVNKWKMTELSLVDVGANPNATIQLVKADGMATDQIAEATEPPPIVAAPDAPPPPEPNRLAEKLNAALGKAKKAALADKKDDNKDDEDEADEDNGGDGYEEKKCDKCNKFHKEGVEACQKSKKSEDEPAVQKAKPNAFRGGDGFESKACEKCDRFHKSGVEGCRKSSKALTAFFQKHYGGGEGADLRQALDIYDQMGCLVMAELSEGEVGDASLVKEAMDLIARFIQKEAEELVEGDGDEGLRPGPYAMSLAEKAVMQKYVLFDATRDLAPLLEEIKKTKESVTKADAGDLAEAIGTGLRQIQLETSEALGELKADLGEFKAMREQVAKMAAQPAMPRPPVDTRALGAGPMPAEALSAEARAHVLLKYRGGAPSDVAAFLERAASLERATP